MKNFQEPKGLSKEARAWWRRIASDLEPDDAQGFLLLQSAMEAFDEMRRAQSIVDKDGPIVEDRFGQKRQHPGVLCVRDARNHVLRALKDLGIEPPGDVGHPYTSV